MTSRLVAVETTARVTSVALFVDGALAAEVEREVRSDVLLTLLDHLLRDAALGPRDVARWAVDLGPGSFTGVRVGVATVKGLAFATGADVVGVTAFDAVAQGRDIAVLLEAGKGEVYHRLTPLAEPGHATLEALRPLLGALPVVGPDVVPRARDVGRLALSRPADDLDGLSPLYVRGPLL